MTHGMTMKDRMFSVRTAPWHLNREGGTTEEQVKVLEDYPGREAAMAFAGHDYEVEEHPIYVDGIELAEGWKALVNSKTGGIIHVAKRDYPVLQNGVLWDVVEAILNQPNVRWETGGTLNDGAKAWVLACLDEPQLVPGDPSPIMPYITAMTSHDGTGALTARNTAIRIVCQNTYGMAEAETARTGREFTFRHSGHVAERIEEAKKVLLGTREQFSEFMDMAYELVQETVTLDQVDRFLAEFIPAPPAFETSERVKENIAKARASVKRILNGPTCEGIGETKWGLFQAGVEYLDYERSYRNPDTLMGRTLLRPEPLKQKLVRLVKRV